MKGWVSLFFGMSFLECRAGRGRASCGLRVICCGPDVDFCFLVGRKIVAFSANCQPFFSAISKKQSLSVCRQ